MVLVVNATYDDSGHEDAGHPERPDRLVAARAAVNDLHLGDDLVIVPAHSASREELARVHNANYLDELSAYCYAGGGDIDQDTYATLDSWTIAKIAAGAGLAVIEELRRRDDGVGFVVTRPPGHHALADRAMGFCLLNNVAVAAAALLSQGERVLIVDWDVHHGNGTQQIFWDEPDVLYVSTHQWPLFPGSGSINEVGGRHATDRTVNIPLPAGATGDVVRRAIDDVAAPVVESFGPTWVLVSAGFDAHRDDPMADLHLTSGDFAQLARSVTAFAPHPGRVAMFLEGGYELSAVRSSVRATLAAALGYSVDAEAPSSGGPGTEHVTRVEQARHAAIEMLLASDNAESS
jgi:acetoin utilization deacetylase AcuC-like enzyme